ncbi:MAG TPA: addiction module protein [Gracilimonas sp.]|uniref:addiction module protein n=1 Tax=Gracilimonas sp. TaxID=1974203 RepID=UPI002D9A977A|nr:addiction module protein [Gracilimonas sp.]
MEDTLIKELSQLNKNEKLLLVEALWDSIASDPKQVDFPEHHKSILEKRLQTLDEDTANGKSWDEIRDKYL